MFSKKSFYKKLLVKTSLCRRGDMGGKKKFRIGLCYLKTAKTDHISITKTTILDFFSKLLWIFNAFLISYSNIVHYIDIPQQLQWVAKFLNLIEGLFWFFNDFKFSKFLPICLTFFLRDITWNYQIYYITPKITNF